MGVGDICFLSVIASTEAFFFSFSWPPNWKLLKTHKFFWKKIKTYFIFSVFSPTVCVILLYLPTFISSHYVDSFWKEKQQKLNSSRAPFGARLFGSITRSFLIGKSECNFSHYLNVFYVNSFSFKYIYFLFFNYSCYTILY